MFKEKQVTHTHEKNKFTDRQATRTKTHTHTHTHTRTQNEQRRNDSLKVPCSYSVNTMGKLTLLRYLSEF